ncbi:MAG: hypothetical protein ACE14P_04145 [Methanotrichaceae archaeon]
MVTFKVDAEVQGTEGQDKRPIVAQVKGTGKDGSFGVQISGIGAPIGAKISGDSASPITIAPITIVPDIRAAAECLNIADLIGSLKKLTEGLKVEVSNSERPIAVSLGKIPVDLTISVMSPAQEQVFKVEIKGSVGGE